jgi:hypothetical protein
MRTFAKPAPHRDEIEYFRRVDDLARDIHSHLTTMAGGPAYLQLAEPDTFIDGFGGTVKGMPTVLLAEVTDDLEPMRSQVKRYLEQGGVLVLPTVSYQRGRTEFKAALETDPRRSNLFVQLLGPIPGKLPRDVPDGYGWLQLDCARRLGVQVIQWRSRTSTSIVLSIRATRADSARNGSRDVARELQASDFDCPQATRPCHCVSPRHKRSPARLS